MVADQNKLQVGKQTLEVPYKPKPWNQSYRIPGSKSLTNRALLVSALAEGTSMLTGVLQSDDTRHMLSCLSKIGVRHFSDGDALKVHGSGGRFGAYSGDLYVENAGTAARFLTAALTLGQGRYLLTGNKRMEERPLKDLLDPLRQSGCQITGVKHCDSLPLEISGGGFPGGQMRIFGARSSQFLSAVMMTAPYAKEQVRIEIEGDLVSKTYVSMTEKLMKSFGISCAWTSDSGLEIERGVYQACDYDIEGDASSASYFFGAAAITNGITRIRGLHPDSSQGDLELTEILAKMGCEVSRNQGEICLKGGPLKGVDVDMNSMSDVAPTLAVVALFAKGKTIIRNVGNMRLKECDRISAIVQELRKTGALVEEWEDGLSVEGQGPLKSAEFSTYDDHRMAMALSLAGLRIPGIRIQNPGCVSKTFPDYFQVFFDQIDRN